MSLNLDSLNNIFKTNKHAITTISELWNQDEIQKLIHESHKEVLDCIKDVEYEFGKSEELEKIRIEFFFSIYRPNVKTCTNYENH